MNRTGKLSIGALAGAFLCCGIASAQLSSDDNGEESFIRQAIPKLLGRKPRGALEVRLLLDVDSQVGRAAVVRSLMRTDEFVDHWTDVLVDMLHMQRLGDRAQDPACFGAPRQAAGPASSTLAAFVRDQPPGTSLSPPGGAFNMVDLIRSSIALDDLSPIYRAYPIPLTMRVNSMAPDTSVGDAINHAILNRDPDCLLCHNSSLSATGNANSAADLANPSLWVRTWPAPIRAEASLYGANFFSSDSVRTETYPVFRVDQVYANLYSQPPAVQPAAIAPWGMVPECGRILTSLAALPPRATHFADKSGNQVGLVDLTASYKTGTDALKGSGLHLLPIANSIPMVPGDQALAYLTAEKVVDDVWKEVVGSPLTIANYFPRNQAQRDALLELTDQVFDAEGWSLRALIAQIMTGRGGASTGYFNRKAPDIDPNSPAYRLALVPDPWVQKDPRADPPPHDPLEHFDGQGELVHRYSVRSLLHSVAAALGWPEPQRFPGSAYPSLQFERTIGQFLSDDYQGRDGVDFQGLLSWESQLGSCDKAGAGVGGDDWIDRLQAAVANYNTSNPTSPLTVGDVVVILKDWLTGESSIGTVAPTALDPAHVPLSEADALTALFGVPLSTSTSAIPKSVLDPKLRRACGAIVESGQFMLAGIMPTAGGPPPSLRVCNATGPCSYQEMCQDLVHLGGYLVLCGATKVAITPGPSLICDICVAFSSSALTLCEQSPGACGSPGLFPVFPIGPPVPDCLVCNQPWVDLSLPTGIYINVATAAVVSATGADFRAFGATAFTPLRAGMPLGSGAMIRLRKGSVLNLKTAGGLVRTPEAGMPGKNESALSPVDRAFLNAVQAGQGQLLPQLLEKGARIDARDFTGRTALMIAAGRNDLKTLGFLLAHRANVFAQTARGRTAADIAALGGHKETLAALARSGATPKSKVALARLGADVEEPWYLFLGRRRALPPKQFEASAYDLQLQHEWVARSLNSRGEAGPALSDAQSKAALARYMATAFSKEHPAASR